MTLKSNFQYSPGLQTLWLLALWACLGLVYLSPKLLSALNVGPQDYFDFEQIWLAGKLWVSGQNPYLPPVLPVVPYDGSSALTASTWFYPPYWYPLIVPFGLLPFKIALAIWKLFNFSLLIAGTYLLARALSEATRKHFFFMFFAGLGFVFFMYATAVTVWSGQTSILVYFGFAALMFGIVRARPHILIVGLVFLALKPQVGALAFVAMVMCRYRWTVLPAGIACLLGSAAIVITGDYRSSIVEFIRNLGRHSEHAANTPQHLTGLIHILNYGIPSASPSVLTIVTFVIALIGVAAVIYRSNIRKFTGIEDTQRIIAGLALFIAITAFCVPLHYYDMIILNALLMIILAAPLQGCSITALGLALCYRPDFILRAFGMRFSDEIFISHIVSFGLIFVVIGTFFSFRAALRVTRSPARQLDNSNTSQAVP